MRALKIDWSEPGAPVSVAAHAALLVAILVGLGGTVKLQDLDEAIPVETVTDAQFNEIMKGEKTAKPLSTPQLKVDRLANVDVRKPAPPTPQAKFDVPAPAARFKPSDNPGEADKPEPVEPPPPAKAAARRTPAEPAQLPKPKPTPTPAPPQHAAAKPQPRQAAPEAKKPPPPEPDEAEVVERAKPPKPAKEAAKPPQPKPVAEATPAPKPPRDQIAKLEEKKLEELAAEPLPKPVEKPKKRRPKPKAGHAGEDALSVAADFLKRDAPQSTGSSGRKLTQTASLGAPESNAPRLSPFMLNALADIIRREYYKCWNNGGLEDEGYVPQFRVRFNPDWTLAGRPQLINHPANAKQSAIARTALQAITNERCNPLTVPSSYARYYRDWKELPIGFNPRDGSG